MATTLDDLRKIGSEDSAKKEKNKDDVTPESHIKAPIATGKKREVTKLPWFLSILLPDDSWSITDLIEYRIKPGIRSGIHSMIIEVIDRWFEDDSRSGRSRSSGSYISYSRYSDKDRDSRSRDRDRREEKKERRQKVEPAFCEIEFESRAAAEEVLDSLDDAMAEYGILNMADVYIAADMTPQYTDYNYGWKDISKAYVERSGSKYRLVMPKAQSIE